MRYVFLELSGLKPGKLFIIIRVCLDLWMTASSNKLMLMSNIKAPEHIVL